MTMSQLNPPLNKRMRSAEDKALRRQALLQAAREIFSRIPYAEIRVQDIVHATGLAKGTFYLYFQSKEILFLELLLDELQGWFDVLIAELGKSRRWSNRGIAELLTRTLQEQTLMRRLLSLLNNVLEASLDAEAALAFKTRLAEKMAPIAAALETALSQLGPGGGAQLLLNLNAIVIGLEQMTHTGPALAEVLIRPELAFLQQDFASELQILLLRLLNGWQFDS